MSSWYLYGASQMNEFIGLTAVELYTLFLSFYRIHPIEARSRMCQQVDLLVEYKPLFRLCVSHPLFRKNDSSLKS